MTFHLAAILASKQRLRARLAVRPIAEKLRLLDALRERTLALRRAGAVALRARNRPPGARERGDAPPRDTER